MGRKLDVDQLVGAAEIADQLGWSHVQNVHTYRKRYPDFPKPVATLTMGLLWYWPDIEAWARATDRLPGQD